jgi:hypothetical protein
VDCFSIIYLGVVEQRFCRGICRFRGATRWYIVVQLWWIVWSTWSRNDSIFDAEK